MARQVKGLLYFFSTDIRYSLTIFWTILLSVLVATLTISYFLLGEGNTTFNFGFPFAIYIYAGISGFLTVKERIPFSLKLGATRKNIFISLGLFFLGLAIANAVIANTLQSIFVKLLDVTGNYTMQYSHLVQLFTDTWLNRVIVDTVVIFFVLAFMYSIGLLFYKYGLLGGGIVIGALVVVLLLGLAQGWIVDFIIVWYSTLELSFFYQMLGVGIMIYCVSFLLLRRITTIKAK